MRLSFIWMSPLSTTFQWTRTPGFISATSPWLCAATFLWTGVSTVQTVTSSAPSDGTAGSRQAIFDF